MKNRFKFSVFIFIFFLSLILAKSEAAIEPVSQLPFSNPGILISMDFQDANLKDILKIFSIQSGLNFIASDAVKDRKFTLYFDNVPIKDAMDKIFKANNLSYDLDSESNIFIVTDLGVPEAQTETKIFPLKFATVSSSKLIGERSASMGAKAAAGGEEGGITGVIKKLISDKGKVIEDPRTNSIIVSDFPSHMRSIEEVIASLDKSEPQIMLEVELLDVSKNAVDKIGMNWPETIAKLTVPGTRGIRFPFTGRQTKSGSGATIEYPDNAFGGGWNYGTWPADKFAPSILTALGATLTLDFLRTLTDTKFLARPQIFTLNNETAEISISTNESVGVKTSTSSAEGTGSTVQEAERAQTGVVLRVTPQVNIDNGEITLFVYPKVAEAVAGSTITSGSATFIFRDPEERSTKSTVRIKNGETVVLGGLIRNEKSETITKLPILGDLPFLGKMFKHSNKSKDKERELLVFITPHIIKDTTFQLAQVQKGGFPEREQSAESGASRQAAINASLKSFEKKKK